MASVTECPNCKRSLEGGLIWEHFYNEFQTIGYWKSADGEYMGGARRILTKEEAAIVADEVASHYGATRTEGKWGHAIGETRNDRVYQWHCPFCKHHWLRE